MTAETVRMVAGVLAQRLGVDASELEASIAHDPMRMVALSLMQDAAVPPRMDPASLVREVAAMVGACAACLGEQPGCEECRGTGKPGWHEPDAAALVRWITPSLQRVGLCIGRPRKIEDATHGGGYIR